MPQTRPPSRATISFTKGLLRALLFGASFSFALIALVPIVFWLLPEIAPPADKTSAVGASSAFALFAARR
jgi:hypothetical protein